MTDFFDTSWLVAAWEAPEEGQANEYCLQVWNARRPGSAVAAHSLAELFHFFTGTRQQPAADFVARMGENLKGVEIVGLSPAHYWSVLRRAELDGIQGRAVYDALLIAAARLHGAKDIWTRNDSAWRHYAKDLAPRIHGLTA